MALHFGIIAFVVFLSISCSSAQYGQQQNTWGGGSSSCGNCVCTQEYIPFCATDGRRETTYSNKCMFECAQKCNPSLRRKFEGVCAEPYNPSKKPEGKGEYWGAASSYEPTRRPFVQTTRSPYWTTTKRSTTTRRYTPSYPVQTTTRRYTPSYPVQTTTRRYNPSYPVQTTRRPSYQPYPEPTTRRPYGSSTNYGPAIQPVPSYPTNDLYGSGSVALPNTISTPTSKPWWQGQNQEQFGGYGRRSRNIDEEEDEYY